MKSETAIRDRIEELQAVYDEFDPPTSELEDEREVATLRAIEELQWVLDEHDETDVFTT